MIEIPQVDRRVWYSKDFCKNTPISQETHDRLQMKGCIKEFKEVYNERYLIVVSWDDGSESKVLSTNLDYC